MNFFVLCNNCYTSIYVQRRVALVGVGFTVDGKYFEQIGAFDVGMKVSGGENLELTWRVGDLYQVYSVVHVSSTQTCQWSCPYVHSYLIG